MTDSATYPSILATLSSILRRLPSRRVLQFWGLAACMLGAAVFETLALGCVAFFASAVTDPAAVLASRPIAMARGWLPEPWLATPHGLIVFLSAAVMVLMVSKNLVLGVVSFWGSRFAAFADGYFGELMVGMFLNRPYEWHLHQNSADLVMSVDWRRYLGVHFLYPVLQMLADGAVIVLMLVVLLVVEPVVSIGAIAVLGSLGAIILRQVRSVLDRNTALCADYQQTINRQVTKSIHGVKDVKVFGKQAFFLSEFTANVYLLARKEAFRQFFTRFPSWFLESIGFAVIAGTICTMMVVQRSTTAEVTGTVALIAVTAWRVLPAVNRILAGLTSLRTVLPYVYNVLSHLGEVPAGGAPEPSPAPDPQAAIRFDRDLRLDRVTFTYTGRSTPTLDALDLRIAKGETIGIIGPSGAGKSTLVDMLIGLLLPGRGQVLIDGAPLDERRYRGWMQLIGYVSQSPYIYDGTLAENIAFGIAPAAIDRDRVAACCRMAAMDFLADLPEGIDAPIGERGLRLSGGQRQRVAIARALYHRPQVMILDEATSALDAKNEEDIQKTVYALRGQLTLIIIAHRLTTVRDCDRLICIDKGAIVADGPPASVLPWYEASQGQPPEHR